MGIDPRLLSPRAQLAVRNAIARQKAGGGGTAVPPPRGEPESRPVFLELLITPPTVTHQDKKILPVARAGGGYRMTLANSKSLRAAHTLYLAYLRPSPRPPIAGPVDVTLCFAWPLENPGDAPGWYECKPDWDNAAKVLCDVLAERGYLSDDQRIAHGEVYKIRWPRPFVSVLIVPATPGSFQRVMALLPAGQAQQAPLLLEAKP